MYSANISAQYRTNVAISHNEVMPWQVNVNGNPQKVMDVPILTWDRIYKSSPKEVIELCRQISDCMMFNPHPLFGRHNPNKPHLYDVVDGVLRQDDYEAVMRLFGEKPPINVADNHFFHGAEETLISQILQQPTRFTVKQQNTGLSKALEEEDSKVASKMAMQGLIEAMMAGGEKGLASFSDKKVKLPRTQQEYNKYLTSQEQLTDLIYRLLVDINKEYPLKEIEEDALYHKFRINAEAGFIDVNEGRIVPQALSPQQIRWLSSKDDIKTLESPHVYAVQINEYKTFHEIINQFQSQINNGTGIKGIEKFWDRIKDKSWREIGYDPNYSYWSEDGIAADSWDYCLNDYKKEYPRQQVNWMRNFYYPEAMGGEINKLMMKILVQRNYFKITKSKRFKVEKIENNIRSAATDKELEKWRKERYNCNYDIDFTPISDKDKAKGCNVKPYTKEEIWQFTRIGHDTFIDVGPYRYQPDTTGEYQSERRASGWPVKLQVGYQKSMAQLGHEDAIKVNLLHQRIMMFMAGLGYEEALIIDDVHGKDPISYRYNAKMTGVVRIESTRFTPGNVAGLKHLQTVKLSNETKQIQELFGLIEQIRLGYEYRVGTGPQQQGISQPYDGLKETQLNIVNQRALNVRYNSQHQKFKTQMIQGMADVAKFLYANDKELDAIVGPGNADILKKTKAFSNAEIGIEVEDGNELSKQTQILDSMTQNLMQSGGSEERGSLFESMLIENPIERVAYLREVDERIRAAEQAAAQSAAQKDQMNYDLKLKEFEVTIQKARIEQETALILANKKLQDKQEDRGLKADMQDVKTSQSREDKLLDAQLQNEQADREMMQQQPQ